MIVSIFRINSETLENNSFWGLEESIGWTDRQTDVLVIHINI